MTVTSSVSTIALRTFPIFQGLGDDRLAAVARCAMMR
ncbi:MAG: Crp/Fnr family transcriptional regulator, partial [Zoogloea sp.]|nr:Crp/Fnr family transcriptional regulator [Zoogloea sp.]